ncbi:MULTISPECIES: carbohydrate kinase family protein [Subtercola]|uniref:carbohydrate kinase family protein n=1 Tax=Subtercola TaxID=120212 RepID=UPI001375A2BD|nr:MULTISPECIES: PfkB family carbohydrate kinase [Subtercola]MEA9985020.1 PfkB family carbohydrate kinase [Subtercola sp. RTI3]
MSDSGPLAGRVAGHFSSATAAHTRVVIVGDVFDDIIVRPSGPIRSDTDTLSSIERRAGGSAANTAAWLGSLGTRVDFVGRTNVVDTQRHENSLRDSGVTPHLLGENVLPTGTIVVIVDEHDTRTMLTERGANVDTSPHDVSDELLRAATHLHFTGYTLFSGQPREGFTELIRRAAQHSVTVSVDPGSSGFIADHGAAAFFDAVRGADILFPNLDEGIALTGLTEPAAIVDALTQHFRIVALTLGRRGALVATSSGLRIQAPCVPVEPVDTTGAGDAFNAGFLSGLLGGLPASDEVDTKRFEALSALAAERGVATASKAIGHVGGRPPHFVPLHSPRTLGGVSC